MNMIPVRSSNLESVGYDGRNLYIRFLNGGLYRYINVPKNVYSELLSAPSKGVYLTRFVKGKYPYQKL